MSQLEESTDTVLKQPWPDATFMGGPRDGEPFVSTGADHVAVPHDGLLHCYTRTDATCDRRSRTYTLYVYAGELRRTGAAADTVAGAPRAPREAGVDRAGRDGRRP